MTRLEQMEGLEKAIQLLSEKRAEVCRGSNAVFSKVSHAMDALDRQLTAMLAE